MYHTTSPGQLPLSLSLSLSLHPRSMHFPYAYRARAGFGYGHQTVEDGIVKDGLWDVYNQVTLPASHTLSLFHSPTTPSLCPPSLSSTWVCVEKTQLRSTPSAEKSKTNMPEGLINAVSTINRCMLTYIVCTGHTRSDIFNIKLIHAIFTLTCVQVIRELAASHRGWYTGQGDGASGCATEEGKA